MQVTKDESVKNKNNARQRRGNKERKEIGKNTVDDVDSKRLVVGITPQTPISSGLKGN